METVEREDVYAVAHDQFNTMKPLLAEVCENLSKTQDALITIIESCDTAHDNVEQLEEGEE